MCYNQDIIYRKTQHCNMYYVPLYKTNALEPLKCDKQKWKIDF